MLLTGVIKRYERPIWYDVYEAFPPTHEPKFGKLAPDIPIREIFYPEDILRAYVLIIV